MGLTKATVKQMIQEAIAEALGVTQPSEAVKIKEMTDRWEKEAIVTRSGLKIAPENYTEGDKEHFTWDEAMEATKKLNGWRLPTQMEWLGICAEFGGKDGEWDGDTFNQKLGMVYSGLYSSGLYSQGSRGYLWSSTVNGSTSAYHLYYNSSNVDTTSNYNKYGGFAVRCVR